MQTSLAFSGIVLAAGHSTRMGRDKALIETDGVPLWRRQRDVLAQAGAAEILLSARPEQPWIKDARSAFASVVHDAFSSGGPIVGVTAGLERASHPWLAVIAIDLPYMSPAWFSALWKDVQPGVGAVGRRGDFFEPLAAIYPREMMWSAWEAIVSGEYSLQHWVAEGVKAGRLRSRTITAAQLEFFSNWNTEADRA